MYSALLEAFKTLASIRSPGVDGGAVELWISGGVGSGSFSKRPLSGPSYRAIANLLAQWKVSSGTVTEYKKTDSYERMRRVTWDWCVTRRFFNHCAGRSLGKCALTTEDWHILLRITEQCSPWTRRSHCLIGGGARRMLGEGGVSNK